MNVKKGLGEEMNIDWDDIPNKIWMKGRKICICTTFKECTPRLLACIEDNIYSKDGYGEAEGIEWAHVRKDYETPATL